MPRHANHSNRTWRNATRVADSPTTCAKSGAASGVTRRTRRDLRCGRVSRSSWLHDSRQAPRVLDQPAVALAMAGGHDPVGRHERRSCCEGLDPRHKARRCFRALLPRRRHASAPFDPASVKDVDEHLRIADAKLPAGHHRTREIVAPNQRRLDPAGRPRAEEQWDHRFGHPRESRSHQSQPTSQLAQTSLFDALRQKVALLRRHHRLINSEKGRPGGRGQTHRGPQQNVTR